MAKLNAARKHDAKSTTTRNITRPGTVHSLYTPHKDVGQAAPEICRRVGVMSVSIYLVAFLPWGVLAPLNLFKLMLNTVSPYAHVWVPKETEQCQAACGIARMWVRTVRSLAPTSLARSTYDIRPFFRSWARMARSISAIRGMFSAPHIGITNLL